MATRLVSPGPPPREGLDYFRAKGLKVGFHHTDVWREEHAAAFTVAKAMETDVLATIRAEVDKALAEGRTFRDFAKDLRPQLEKAGWWGRKEMVDPITGEVRDAQLGSPRRLRTIFNNNMRTARAAGQWERIQRTKATHPYLLYELGPAEHHRPEHVGWAGLLLPVDDPWWATHYPPNAWGCKCRVRQVSRAEAARLDRDGVPPLIPEQEKDPDTGLPTGHFKPGTKVPVRREPPPLRTRGWKNLRTGQVHQVPVGIDPGWDYNPGAVGRLAKSLELAGEKLEAAPPDLAEATVRKLVSGPSFAEWYHAPRGEFPVAVLQGEDAGRIKAKQRVVRFSPDTLGKQLKRHKELTPEEYALVQDACSRGERIQDTARSLVFILEDPGYVAVVKATRTGQGTYLTSFRRLSHDEGVMDREVRRLRARGKK